MIDDLKPLLQDLPEPAPPSSITVTVMARIARDVERRADDQFTAPARRTSDDVAAWACTFAGVAVVLVVFAYGWFSTGSTPDLTAPRIGPGRSGLMPVLGPFSAVLALGLLVYVAGLFSPLRSHR